MGSSAPADRLVAELTAMSHNDPFGSSIEHARGWLNSIDEQLNLDDRFEALSILRNVLQALRERLPLPVAAHLSAQLPLLLRGVFWEGWSPHDGIDKMTVQEFVDRIDHATSLKGVSETEDAIRVVTSVMWDELGSGIIGKIVSVLPSDFGVLF
jgi:uncharacterized protein (DUF2267 family)